ncbi:MAG TPA: ribose-phosphate diphosphokinase [Burkholderiaceae bacterium]|nr:ribose-phosphate diphosphokinase [Burkholderiaceae bacterium]
MLLLAFEDEHDAAARISAAAGLPCARIERHRFPDGELKLTLPTELPERVALLRSLNQPNEKLVELLLTARTARELGVRHLTLVAPYLGYMRQDIAFHPGEAVSQRVIGRFLAGLFDRVITVDPHLHRIERLDQAIPIADAVAVSAAASIGEFLRTQMQDAVLLGPDEESSQWVRIAAQAGDFAWACGRKARHGDHEVDISLPTVPLSDRHVVLLDDMASTGMTLAHAAQIVRAAGASQVDVAVTHALFVGRALETLQDAGIGRIWSTDTVAHGTNAVSVVPLLAEALIRDP